MDKYKDININNQKMIYFNSPQGTYSRIQYCLYSLGLDKKKKIGNTFFKDFSVDVASENNLERYFNYDVIYLDEFYDFGFESKAGKNHIIESDEMIQRIIDFMQKLTGQGIQIVMAGHGKLNSLRLLPKELEKHIVEIDLLCDEEWSYDYKIEYRI